MAYDNIHYTPITELELDGPAVPASEQQFCAAQLAAAWETYNEVQEASKTKAEKAYQAYLAKSEAAYQAAMRELDF